jgi:hypothetical protein
MPRRRSQRKADRRLLVEQRRRAGLPPSVRAAHDHCSDHRGEVLGSDRCGCFYCGSIFQPSEIKDWIDPADDELASGNTALCPRCGIDSVIGDRSGYPITAEFMTTMHDHWF